MLIDNDIALDLLVMQDMSLIVEEVSQELLGALKKNIRLIVYNPFKPSKNGYERQGENGGFLGSWVKTNADIKGRSIESNIYSDSQTMKYEPESFIHGSIVNDVISDVRQVLAEIINEGKSGSYFDWTAEPHWWKSPRMFWEATEELILNGWVDGRIESAFRRHGMKFRKI